MMKRSLFSILVGLALVVGCATTGSTDGNVQSSALTAEAASDSNAATADEQSEVDDGDKVICRRERVTGSRIAMQKVCLTGKEWDARLRRTQDGLRDVGRGGAAAPSPEMGGGD
ncbi:hypothetical protein [Hyphococcus lacteus]|uniref:Uncharacterized protein n=1 Tax=Hyphococcus lacteus TaxID=3143536 RepID=A0ABV3Z6M2_9PROT